MSRQIIQTEGPGRTKAQVRRGILVGVVVLILAVGLFVGFHHPVTHHIMLVYYSWGYPMASLRSPVGDTPTTPAVHIGSPRLALGYPQL
jgi:hypothetical protein